MNFLIILTVFSCYFNVFVFSKSIDSDLDTKLSSKIEEGHLLKLMKDALENDAKYEEANTEFQSAYAHGIVEISYVSQQNQFILPWDGGISVDFSLADKFLKAFGKSIQNISIACHLVPVSNHIQVSKSMNDHCADTLLQFETKSCPENVFNGMQKPFKNVETVILNGEWRNPHENGLGMNQLFPKMQHLNLTYTDGHIFDRYYTHLNELNVFSQTSDGLANMIRKNRHIKTLRVEETSTEFLKEVNASLSNLETIAFNVPYDLQYYEGPQIQFNSVTSASISDIYHHIRFGKIGFRNLKHFELLVNGHIKDEWIEIIENTKELETLNIGAGYYSDSTLLSLSKRVTGLTEASINCDSKVSPASIVQFLESNDQMKETILRFPGSSMLYYKYLKEQLGDMRIITPIDNNYSILKVTALEPFVFGVIDEDSNQNITNSKNSTSEITSEETPGSGSTILTSINFSIIAIVSIAVNRL